MPWLTGDMGGSNLGVKLICDMGGFWLGVFIDV